MSPDTSPRLWRECAWCRRIYVRGWVSLRQALERAGVSGPAALGPRTHGICEDCFAEVAPAARAAA
jgi:hypothetical protein